jgi:sodium/pantothenate symporter
VNPDAPEKSLRRLTYIVTTVVGVAAVIGALNPPQYLQYIIVSAAGGMGVVLLIPIALGLYWERFNALGATAAMLGGLVTYSALWITGFVTYAKFKPYLLFHCDPIIPALLVSLLLGVGATYLAPPTRQAVIDKLFYK